MNRAQRRRQRSATRIRALQRRVEETGLPGVVDGLTGACRDCTGGGQFILLPGHRIIGPRLPRRSLPDVHRGYSLGAGARRRDVTAVSRRHASFKEAHPLGVSFGGLPHRRTLRDSGPTAQDPPNTQQIKIANAPTPTVLAGFHQCGFWFRGRPTS